MSWLNYAQSAYGAYQQDQAGKSGESDDGGGGMAGGFGLNINHNQASSLQTGPINLGGAVFNPGTSSDEKKIILIGAIALAALFLLVQAKKKGK